MPVNTYKKGQHTQLTEHFTLSEFQCKCGTCSQVLHDSQLFGYLEQIRCHFGKPVIITSGYRCAKHNAAVGGASGSLHTKGQAADFYISGIDPQQIAAYAESLGIQGIGLYGPEDGNFVHIDTRNAKSFWYGHKQAHRDTFAQEMQTGIYVLTCRVDGILAVQTLVFDASLGEQIHPVPGHQAAIRMTLRDGNVEFSPVTLGNVTVEILRVRPWQT